MNGELTYPNSLTSDKEGQVPTLTEEEEAKIKALHDVETIRTLRTCMEDAQYLTDNKETCLKIVLALFDKIYDKVEKWIGRALGGKFKIMENSYSTVMNGNKKLKNESVSKVKEVLSKLVRYTFLQESIEFTTKPQKQVLKKVLASVNLT